MEGYGSGPKMWELLVEFWDNQEVVTRQNGYHSPPFRGTCSTINGGIALPKIFNVAFDSVVLHWILLMVEEKSVIQDGLGHTVGQILGLFYTYDCLLGSRDL